MAGQERSRLPEVGAAMDFYESVKGSYPTAQQIQELFACIGVQVTLEQIEADKALLLKLMQTEGYELLYGRNTHD